MDTVNTFHPYVLCNNLLNADELSRLEPVVAKYDLMQAKVGNTIEASVYADGIRKSQIRFFGRDDMEHFDIEWLFSKLDHAINQINRQYFQYEIYSTRDFQYTTYDASYEGHYSWHFDAVPDVEKAVHRKLSMSIFLNEDYEGGEFQISFGNNDSPVSFKDYAGSAIIFPSFMTHRVKPITKGIRKSLVVWFTGPYWK
jgi:hypothetical protein